MFDKLTFQELVKSARSTEPNPTLDSQLDCCEFLSGSSDHASVAAQRAAEQDHGQQAHQHQSQRRQRGFTQAFVTSQLVGHDG